MRRLNWRRFIGPAGRGGLLRAFGAEGRRREVLRAVERERGLYQDEVWRNQRFELIKTDLTGALAQDDLFASAEELKEFVEGVRNNNVLLDYLLKYERLADIDLVFLAFERMERNFTSLARYKQEAEGEFRRNLERYRAERQVDAEAEVEFPLVFLGRAEFRQQALYRLFVEKVVGRAVRAALAEGQLLKVVVAMHAVARQDPEFPDSATRGLLVSHLKSARVFRQGFLDAEGPESASLLYQWVVKLLAIDSPALQILSAAFRPKLVRLLGREWQRLRPDAALEISLALYRGEGDRLTATARRLLRDLADRVGPYFKGRPLDDLFWLLIVYSRLPKQEATAGLLAMELTARLKQGPGAEPFSHSLLKAAFELPNTPALEALRREVITQFPQLQFIEPELPFIALLHFYLSKMIAYNLVSRVQLSFVSDYLFLIDQANLDIESFAFVYYQLTLHGYNSLVLAKHYLSPILAALTPKALLGSGPTDQAAPADQQGRRPGATVLDLFWAFTVNTRLGHEASKESAILENYVRLLKEFRKGHGKLECLDPSDADKVALINYHIWLWRLPQSLYLAPGDLLLPADRTPLEAALRAAELLPDVQSASLQFLGKSRVFVVDAWLRVRGQLVLVLFNDQSHYVRIREGQDGQPSTLETSTLLRLKRQMLQQFSVPFVELGINDLASAQFDVAALAALSPIVRRPDALGRRALRALEDRLRREYTRFVEGAVSSSSLLDSTLAGLGPAEEAEEKDEYPDSDDEDYRRPN